MQSTSSAFWAFAQKPRPGEVYNLGGGRDNAASLVECVEMIQKRTGRRPRLTFLDRPRVGDHVCYYTDMRKFVDHYPAFRLTYSLPRIIDELVETARAQPPE